jgi:hypothetical protein
MGWIKVEVAATRRGRGMRVKVRGQRVVVGRGEDAAIRVEDDRVSRHHVAFVLAARGWLVEDLGSANGVFLNDQRVTSAEVRARDVVRLGEGGPKVHVIALDPVPRAAEDDLEATRYVRVEPGLPSPAAPVTIARPRPREPLAPWLLVLGLLFGIFTGLEVWPARFPYREVAAPAVWAARGLAPLFEHDRAGWLVALALGLHAGLVGLVLQRPSRRWPFLLVLGLAHAASYFALTKP